MISKLLRRNLANSPIFSKALKIDAITGHGDYFTFTSNVDVKIWKCGDFGLWFSTFRALSSVPGESAVKSVSDHIPLSRQAVDNKITTPPAAQPQGKGKKTKIPKINQALVKELEKIDEEFKSKRRGTEAIFPFPKSNLHNAYAVISSQLGTPQSVEFEYQRISEAPMCWECTVRTGWPMDAHFISRAESKTEAGHRASLITLQWLQSLGKVNSKGEVDLMLRMNKPATRHAIVAEIQLSSKSLFDVENIVNRYYEVVLKNQEALNAAGKNVLEEVNTTESESLDEDDADLDLDSLPLVREKKLLPHVAVRRDQELFRRYEQMKTKRDEFSGALPIDKFKDEIISLVNTSRVVVIKGEPGCGKSTQIPQYLFEWYAAKSAATECNIVVTQPRRISAMSLADRVAHERNEQVGDVVGFHVRLNAKHPKYQDGYILFCSTGLLVNKMIGDPGLSGATHVVVDEAHERDIQLDLLLLLLKRALNLNPSLKVIIMSATINAELFTQYFNNCPSISIPGFTFPVKHQFLDGEIKSLLLRRRVKLNPENVDTPVVNIEAVVAMITWIDESKPEGAILVFLPGWIEIQRVMEKLASLPGDGGHFMIVPAHSMLSSEEQHRIFHTPQSGQRKVILATNIAETSLTINDVVYVVDTGTVKEERLDLKSGLVCLDNQWASQANVRQRRGRAGRVQPGLSYHLFTEGKYNLLDEFPLPEVHRIPLTRTILDVKMHTLDGDVKDFLSGLPEPPSPESIDQAVRVLQDMGALDHEGDLTALGRRIYRLPLQPHLSKALVHSCILKCASPMLSLVTLLAADTKVFVHSLGAKNQIRLFKQKYSPSSDHLASARIYQEWQHEQWANPSKAQMHAQQHGLLYKGLLRTSQLENLHAELLAATKIIPDKENVIDTLSPSNKFALYDELIKGVLLSGLGSILVSKQMKKKQGLITHTLDGSLAIINSESVNSKFKELPSPFLTYFKSMSSTERQSVMVHDTSLLSPVSVVLFFPGVVTLKNMADLDPGKSVISFQLPKPINIIVDQKEGEQLLHLRQVLWNVLEYLVENEGQPRDVEQYNAICQFRDDLLHVLANLTNEQSTNIDYTESGELRKEPPIVYSYLNRG